MKVWIDQDLCTGDGLCEEIAPDVFTLLDDGLAYVKEGDKIFATAKGNPQGADVLARLAQGGGELLVLGYGLGELALGLEEPLLQGAYPLGRILQPATQDDDFLFQRLHLLLEITDLAFVFSEASLVLGGHVTTSHCGRALAAHPTPGF